MDFQLFSSHYCLRKEYLGAGTVLRDHGVQCQHFKDGELCPTTALRRMCGCNLTLGKTVDFVALELLAIKSESVLLTSCCGPDTSLLCSFVCVPNPLHATVFPSVIIIMWT